MLSIFFPKNNLPYFFSVQIIESFNRISAYWEENRQEMEDWVETTQQKEKYKCENGFQVALQIAGLQLKIARVCSHNFFFKLIFLGEILPSSCRLFTPRK